MSKGNRDAADLRYLDRVRALALIFALGACGSPEVRYGSLIGLTDGGMWPIRAAADHAVILADVTHSDGSVHHASVTVLNQHQLLTAGAACTDAQRIQLANTHPVTVVVVDGDLCLLQSATALWYPLALAWEYEFVMPLDHHLRVEDSVTPWPGQRISVLWRGANGRIAWRVARVQSRRRTPDGDRGALTGRYTAEMLGAIVYTNAQLGGVVGVVTGEDAEHRPLIAWTRTLHRFLNDADAPYIVGTPSGRLVF